MADFAFVFPGQGSQKIGMLADIARSNPIIQATFAQASTVLGYDLWALVQDGVQEDINLTEKTQPILLTASIALWRLWNEKGGARPAAMAGHSLGEFSALVCSGVIDFDDAVKLVRLRGQLMQSAVPVGVGAMAAVIGIDDAVVIECCEQASDDQVVQAVNFNSPGQVVIAGHSAAVERAGSLLKEKGCKKLMPLPVSAPFHTSLMQGAGEALADYMANLRFSAPTIPVVHNVHARPESDPDEIRVLLKKQISNPVNWTGCVRYMVQKGIAATIECGPGKVLCGLNKRIDKSLQCAALEDPAEFEQVIAQYGA